MSAVTNSYTLFLDIDNVIYSHLRAARKKQGLPSPELPYNQGPSDSLSFSLDGNLMHSSLSGVTDSPGDSTNVLPLALYDKAVACLHECIEAINGIYKVQIVITSDRRLNHSVEELKSLLGNYKFTTFITGVTKQLDATQAQGLCQESEHINTPRTCRAAEIQEYLNSHPDVGTSYCIFDDANDQHLQEHFGKRFILVKAVCMLTKQNQDDAIALALADSLSLL